LFVAHTPELSYQHSIRSNAHSLFILGRSAIMMSRVLGWNDRVDTLVASGNWIEALALALDYFESAIKIAIGTQKEQLNYQTKLKETIVELLMQYVQIALT
jgi:hypothetical protein